ncbi:MAG: hypothetical protein HDR79_08810 [Bacteroides sp.]|nr:hypothetical protein [Bacteroides sp.]
MTAEEQQEYNRLPDKAKKVYNFTKEMHPSWCHKQIIAKVGFDAQIGTIVGKSGGSDINPKDPSTLLNILEGGKRFLQRYGINIGKIMDAINTAISGLRRAISAGLDFIGKSIAQTLSWIFD